MQVASKIRRGVSPNLSLFGGIVGVGAGQLNHRPSRSMSGHGDQLQTRLGHDLSGDLGEEDVRFEPRAESGAVEEKHPVIQRSPVSAGGLADLGDQLGGGLSSSAVCAVEIVGPEISPTRQSGAFADGPRRAKTGLSIRPEGGVAFGSLSAVEEHRCFRRLNGGAQARDGLGRRVLDTFGGHDGETQLRRFEGNGHPVIASGADEAGPRRWPSEVQRVNVNTQAKLIHHGARITREAMNEGV